MDKKLERFIVVAWYGGIPYMLQYRNMLNWYFDNNHIKVYKSKQAAIKNAWKVSARYKYDTIKVYSITEGEMVDTDHIRKWEHEEAERIMLELKKITTNNMTRYKTLSVI